MLRRMLLLTGAIALTAAGLGVSAQEEAPINWFEATILEVDQDEREITVQLENEERETYRVSEDAQLIRTSEHFEELIELADLNAGDEVELEFDGVEGRATLRRITAKG